MVLSLKNLLMAGTGPWYSWKELAAARCDVEMIGTQGAKMPAPVQAPGLGRPRLGRQSLVFSQRWLDLRLH